MSNKADKKKQKKNQILKFLDPLQSQDLYFQDAHTFM